MRTVVRLVLATMLLAATCNIAYADGPIGNPCVPGSPTCPGTGGGGNGGALHLPTTGLQPTLVQVR